VRADTVLDTERLGETLAQLPENTRRDLLSAVEMLADAGERLS
jgi:hypothetical protein